MFCLTLLAVLLAGCGVFPGSESQSNGSGSLQVQQAPRSQLTYVAIGASDTYGIGADTPRSQNWASDLANQLGPDVHLVNLGVPGIVLHQALRVELPVALDSKPDLVTIWLAVNDLSSNVPLKNYAQDLDLMLSRLRSALPRSQIAIANVPDITLLPSFASQNLAELQKSIQAYNQIIAASASKYHVILIDLYKEWNELQNHPEYISSDGLHPSTAGYARIAELFYQGIRPK